MTCAAQINKIVPSIQSLVDAFSSMRTQYGGDKLVRDVDTAAKLVDSINALGNSMGVNFTAVKDMFAWIGPVLTALQGNAICDANPSCSDTRSQFEKLVAARNNGNLDQINDLAHQLQGFGDKQTLNATVNKLNGALANVAKAVNAMGLDKPGGPQAGLTQLRQGADRLAGGSQQVAGGVDQLVDQIKVMACRTQRGIGIPVDDEDRRRGPVDGGVQHSGRSAGAGGVPEGRQGVHLAGRPLGAVPGANQTQPVQLRGDGSGQRDQRHRPGSPAEHHAGRRHDLDGRVSRCAAGHPRLLRARHPIHHRRDPHRRSADPDGAAACDRRTARISLVPW